MLMIKDGILSHPSITSRSHPIPNFVIPSHTIPLSQLPSLLMMDWVRSMVLPQNVVTLQDHPLMTKTTMISLHMILSPKMTPDQDSDEDNDMVIEEPDSPHAWRSDVENK
ncbi:unnamed protein product [Absidia cylindrospora]